jgi:gliding motility-associated-like protein
VTNKDCFTDEYNFKINFVDCFCKEHIPNAFTPNGDNINDKFMPRIICQTQQVSEYRFSIFNRWGTKVFFTSSRTQAWDGTYMGKPVATGVYVYLLEYKAGESQKVKTVKGTVLALR